MILDRLLLDVSSTPGRTQMRCDSIVPTLKSSTRVYDCRKHRLVRGPSLLACQGFDVVNLNLDSCETTAHFSHLYGNAMSIPVVAAVLTAMVMCLPEMPCQFLSPAHPPPALSLLQYDDDDSDDSQSSESSE